ncbi:MAG: hypothetical protein AAGI68_01365 [Planctomycetota bacterium]
MLFKQARSRAAGVVLAFALVPGFTLTAEPIEAPLALHGRAQGNGQGQANPHQQKPEKGNVGYNAKQGFAFRSFIVFDLSANLVDVEDATKIELVTHYQWGGEGSKKGWEFICLGAYDDADLTNKTVMNWGEADGNRYAKTGPSVGTGDPSQGKSSYGVDGKLTLDVTEFAAKSGVSVEKPYLWFRVQAAQTDEPESWGGTSASPIHTKLLIHVAD